MTTTEAQRRASAAYSKTLAKRIVLTIPKEQRDLAEWLESKPNVNAYLRALIRTDMEQGK